MVACRRAKPGERPALRHGLSPTPTYSCYLGAKSRCKWDPHYIEKGIQFRFTSFEQWFAELGHRPEARTPMGEHCTP